MGRVPVGDFCTRSALPCFGVGARRTQLLLLRECNDKETRSLQRSPSLQRFALAAEHEMVQNSFITRETKREMPPCPMSLAPLAVPLWRFRSFRQ